LWLEVVVQVMLEDHVEHLILLVVEVELVVTEHLLAVVVYQI
jgi:hypothetical protein